MPEPLVGSWGSLGFLLSRRFNRRSLGPAGRARLLMALGTGPGRTQLLQLRRGFRERGLQERQEEVMGM